MVKFNDKQLEAINSINGAIQVVAASGSGKSSVLVERILNMIKNHNIDSDDILTISFTNASATDLKNKLAEKGISVLAGTFHVICKKLLEDIGYDNLTNFPNMYKLKREMEMRTGEKNINIKDIISWIDYQKAYGLTYSDILKEKESIYNNRGLLRDFFMIYEEFNKKNNCYDFNDWMNLTVKEYENGRIKRKWKYVLVDECQDLSGVQHKLVDLFCSTNNIFEVGDVQQCWEENCTVRLQDGTSRLIKNIKIGDMVECNNGGRPVYRAVTNITKKTTNKVVTFTTESGKEITTTLNHKFFVHDPLFENDTIFLYLMYRSDKGFRIGLTFGEKTKKIQNRVRAESPDRFWIIERFTNKNEAYFYEEYYSLKYKIPKIPFFSHGHGIGMSQSELDKIFEIYGNNGFDMIKDFDMDFDYPNYVTENANGDLQNNICFNHYIQKRGKKDDTANYSVEYEKNHERHRKYFYSYKDAYMYAKKFKEEIENYFIYEKVSMEHSSGIPYRTVNASNVTIDMQTIASNGIEFNGEMIKNKEIKTGMFIVYNIEVAESGTMVANDILTHNCIYEFRGATPELFQYFDKSHLDTKVINMNINYRSCNNIVEAANNFIRPYNKKYANYVDSAANNKDDGCIECYAFKDEEDEAVHVVKKIKRMLDDGVNPKDIAVLYRNHSCSDYIEKELVYAGIKYKTFNENSLFDRKEIKGILSVLRLIIDCNDDEAFENLLNSRFYPVTYYKGTLIDTLRIDAAKRNYSMYESFIDYDFKANHEIRNRDILTDMIGRLKLQKERHLPANKIMDNIVKMFKIKENLKNNYDYETYIDKVDSVTNFVNMGNTHQVGAFVKMCNNGNIKRKKQSNCIELRTIHSAKGLEWDNTFLVGLKQDKFPSSKSNLLSEARLMYVGITRAKKSLYLSCTDYSDFYQEYTSYWRK